MGTHGFLQLSPDVPTTAHSHLSPSNTTKQTADPSNIGELVTSVKFNVQLRGLAVEEDVTTFKMYCPRVRRSQFIDCDVSHLDVVSCWKGLSCAQATELIAWERLFRECLSEQVEKHLENDVFQHLDHCSLAVDEFSLVPRLLECLSEKRSRLIDIDLTQLTRDMVELFYERHANRSTTESFPWSLGSRDLPSFVYNFIRTQDCFFSDSTGPYLSVQYANSAYVNSVFTVTVDLAWHRPDVEFDKCIIWMSNGEEYRIAPYHVEPEFNHQSSSFHVAPDHTYFSLSRASVPLQWDADQECFRVSVFDLCLSGNSVAEAVVCAHFHTPFPGNVRFERISRHSIKLHETRRSIALDSPYSSRPDCSGSSPTPCTPAMTFTPLSKLRSGESRRKICGAALNEALEISTRQEDSHTTIFDYSMECDNPTKGPSSSLPKKRRASLYDKYPSFSIDREPTLNPWLSLSDKQNVLRPYKSLTVMSGQPHPGLMPLPSSFSIMSGQPHPRLRPLPSSSTDMKRSHSPDMEHSSSPDMKGSFALDQFQHRDLEMDSKRRKIRRADSMEALESDSIHTAKTPHEFAFAPMSRNVSQMTSFRDEEVDFYAAEFKTGPMGQANGSPPWLSRFAVPKMQSSPPRRSIPVRLKAVRDTIFRRRWGGSQPGPSKFNAVSTKHSTDDETNYRWRISPPDTASNSTVSQNSTELSQAQIQQNYREFEEQALRRNVSQMYDGGMSGCASGFHATTDSDKELESAFLEDSEAEDWVSDESVGEGSSE